MSGTDPQTISKLGFKKLARDAGILSPPPTRTVGETPQIDPRGEGQRAAHAPERAAASASNVRLDTLVNRFRQNRLYEE
jgi:hypothetical protein